MPRASTTFLYYTLGKHPQMFVPSRKELEYFTLNQGRGAGWYENFFSDMTPEQAGFDISPMYFFGKETADRILAYFDSPRVILVLRDPAEFAVSYYKNRIASQKSVPEFDDFLTRSEYEKDGSSMEVCIAGGEVSRSIEAFKNALSDRLLLVDYRCIKSDPVRALNAIESFCGVAKYFSDDTFENIRVNASDQLNHGLVNRLMHQRWFVDLVIRLVPKKLIMKVRLWVQGGKSKDHSLLDASTEDELLNTSRDILQEDVAYYESQFPDGPFYLGSGARFS